MNQQIIRLLAESARRSGHDLLNGRDPAAYVDKLLELAEILTWQQHGNLQALVAFYANDMSSRQAFITMVAVSPEHRGKGIATSLLTSALSIMSSRGLRKCRLEVARRNEQALRLYSSLGFIEVDRNDHSHMLEINLEVAAPVSRR